MLAIAPEDELLVCKEVRKVKFDDEAPWVNEYRTDPRVQSTVVDVPYWIIVALSDPGFVSLLWTIKIPTPVAPKQEKVISSPPINAPAQNT